MTDDAQQVPALPEEDWRDKALRVAKAAAGELPGGSLLAEIVSLWIQPPYEKRQRTWMEHVIAGLLELQEHVRGFNAQNAFQDETFFTSFLLATEAAIRTHQAEKREALRNAILNSALPGEPDEDLQLMFINYIGELTPWHLRLLHYFADPIAYAVSKGTLGTEEAQTLGSPLGVPARSEPLFFRVFPALVGQKMLIDSVVRELDSRNLITGDWPNRAEFYHSYSTTADNRTLWHQKGEGKYHEAGPSECHVTEAGRKFLAYIESPFVEGESRWR